MVSGFGCGSGKDSVGHLGFNGGVPYAHAPKFLNLLLARMHGVLRN